MASVQPPPATAPRAAEAPAFTRRERHLHTTATAPARPDAPAFTRRERHLHTTATAPAPAQKPPRLRGGSVTFTLRPPRPRPPRSPRVYAAGASPSHYGHRAPRTPEAPALMIRGETYFAIFTDGASRTASAVPSRSPHTMSYHEVPLRAAGASRRTARRGAQGVGVEPFGNLVVPAAARNHGWGHLSGTAHPDLRQEWSVPGILAGKNSRW